MVIKTEVCSFSGFKIPVAKGRRYIKADGRVLNFFSSKCEAHFLKKKNPRKVTWTAVYRKVHRKGLEVESKKKKVRKIVKVQRPLASATVEDIKKRKTATARTEVRDAAKAKAVAELKARKEKAAGKKTAGGKGAAAAPKPTNKNVKSGGR